MVMRLVLEEQLLTGRLEPVSTICHQLASTIEICTLSLAITR